MSRRIVIYARYSSDMQSPKSCADQERDVRSALTRLGIDHRLALVIHDEAESGTKTFRAEAANLEAMSKRGEISILAVDDQARFSRADNASSMITDLVYDGGRFISTGEGIDTIQPGWELRVKVMELHNSTTIRELGRRVRRGQRGRLLARLTAGDYPYGYESFVVHPEKITANGRGPKPEKDVRINEAEARWVRQIFEWLLMHWSLSGIATELTRLNVERGRRCRKGAWTHQQVRKIVSNPKYVGSWIWGTTLTLRNSKGKVKQVPVPPDEWVRVVRDDLRIIDQETWSKAQEILANLKEVYGYKEGQSKRGPRVHHTAAYPTDLLQGLIFCECGARMHHRQSNSRRYLACPKAGAAPGMCSMRTQVPVEKAKAVILHAVADKLKSRTSWVDQTLAAMNAALKNIADQIPLERDAERKWLADLDRQIETLVDNLSRTTVQSEVVFSRLQSLETDAARLRSKIKADQEAKALPAQLPDSNWLQAQLEDLPSVLEAGGTQAALLLRNLLGKVHAFQILPPGKKRGYIQLRFRIVTWQLLQSFLAAPLVAAISELANGQDAADEEFCIDLGTPTRMDQWGPQIARWRAEGVAWKEIWQRSGLGSGPAYVCWKRYVDSQSISDERLDSITDVPPSEDYGDDEAA